MVRTRRSRRFVSVLLVSVMLIWVTGLFGAGQSAKITVPAHKSKVSGVINIKAEVDAGRSLAYVVLVVDELRPASTNSSPCTFELDTRELSDGPHKVSIEAYDSAGMIAASKAVTIYVQNEAPEPVVVVKRPPTAPKAVAHSRSAKPRAASAPVVTSPESTAVTTPPKSTVAVAKVAPKSIATAEAAARPAASAAPVTTMRGAAPEPTRTAVLVTTAPRTTDRAETTALAGTMAAPSVATPPVVKLRPGSAGRTPGVIVNGKRIEGEVPPAVVGGRMQSGLRALFTTIGAKISWLAKARTAHVVSGSLTIEVPVGSRTAKVNGTSVDMGGTARLANGRTVVPVRFFAEATGAQLSWDAQTGVAKVWTPAGAVAKNVP